MAFHTIIPTPDNPIVIRSARLWYGYKTPRIIRVPLESEGVWVVGDLDSVTDIYLFKELSPLYFRFWPRSVYPYVKVNGEINYKFLNIKTSQPLILPFHRLFKIDGTYPQFSQHSKVKSWAEFWHCRKFTSGEAI